MWSLFDRSCKHHANVQGRQHRSALFVTAEALDVLFLSLCASNRHTDTCPKHASRVDISMEQSKCPSCTLTEV